MGVSLHSSEYTEMKNDFIKYFMTEYDHEYSEAVEIWYDLDSIMNDYGAVDWT